ncbi:hypothetical protein EDB81DRAFT_39385 [Dactylonectria macrodidyma]|uniref:Secreted protein n=1 Tax=Dactylonectria macrodidyma TaxID=307937 RepID=A0A9P9FTP5_9HYPO|nr:hypothetical protein EDB81DRAFT_39385 [Dactylonectria macrodidyma]
MLFFFFFVFIRGVSTLSRGLFHTLPTSATTNKPLIQQRPDELERHRTKSGARRYTFDWARIRTWGKLFSYAVEQGLDTRLFVAHLHGAAFGSR